MEDAAKIGFQADTTGLVKAKDALDDLVPAAGRAQKASEKLARGTSKASEDLIAEVRKMDMNISRMTAAMSGGFKSVVTGLSGIGTAARPASKALTDLEKASREVASMSRPMQQATASIKLLDAQLKQGVIAADQYAAAVDRLEAAFLSSGGAANQWSSVIGSNAQKVVASTQVVKKAAGNTQASVGNMFAQFNDIGVTAAMGMNPAIIALQQGTQIAQGFVGVGLGAAAKSIGGAFLALLSPVNLLAIGLTGLVAFGVQLVSGWFTAGEEAEKLDKTLSGINSSFDQYKSFVETAATRTSELSKEFGSFTLQVKDFSGYMAEVALGQAFNQIGAAIEPMKGGLAEVQTQLAGVEMYKQRILTMDKENAQAIADQNDYMQIAQDAAEAAAQNMGLTATQAQLLAGAMDELKKAKTLEEMATASEEALKIVRQIWPEGQRITSEFAPAVFAMEQFLRNSASSLQAQRELADATGQTANASGQLVAAVSEVSGKIGEALTPAQGIGTALWDAASAAASVVSSAPGGGWLSGAIADAAALATKLWDAVTAGLNLPGAGGSGGVVNLDDRGVPVDPGLNGGNKPKSRPFDLGLPDVKSGSSGGGGGASKALTELQKLAEEFNKLKEPFDQAQTAVKAIDTALANGIIGNDEYAKSLSRVEAAFLKSGGSADEWAKVITKSTKSAAQQMKDLQKSSIEGLGDAIADLAVDGSANFGDMAKSIIKSMIKIAVQAAIIEPLLKMFGLEKGGAVSGGASPLALAKGGVIGNNGLHPFAKGGSFTNKLFDSPTMFAFAKGGALGVMGEAGPEAVMPLARGQDGSLGVQMHGAAQGNAKPVSVVQQVINNADGTQARQENEVGADGIEYQRIIIETTKEGWARGEFDDVSRARNNQSVVRTVR